MGWGRMLLLGNVGQQLDIGDLENAIQNMHDEVARTESAQEQSIEKLQQENHDLKLYVATILRLLVSKGVLQAAEVRSTVEAIDKK